MFKKIKSLLETTTVRQSIITSLSTFASAGLGAVFYLVLARTVGVKEYGLFSLSLSLLLTGSSIADLGMSPTIVRFVSGNSIENKYFPYANIALRIKLFTGILCFIVLSLFSNPIAEVLFHQPALAPLVPFAGFGIIAMILFSFSASVLQGLQNFFWWGGIQVGSNTFRLLVLFFFILLGWLNAKSSLILFAGPLFLAFLISWKKIPLNLLKSSPTKDQFIEFWQYNKWTAAFTVVAAIVSRLDTFMAARYVPIDQIGIYSLALTMVSFLPQLSSALGAVTAPKFASYSNIKESHHYFRKALLFSSGVSIATAVLMIPTAMFVIWFTGKDFGPAFIPFLVLLLGICIFSASGPVRDSILFSHKKPQFFVWGGLVQGLVVVAVCSFLLPKLGIVGASISILLSHIALLFMAILYYRSLHSQA